jgi:hypothetical protein
MLYHEVLCCAKDMDVSQVVLQTVLDAVHEQRADRSTQSRERQSRGRAAIGKIEMIEQRRQDTDRKGTTKGFRRGNESRGSMHLYGMESKRWRTT